ncbi:MAG TPA: hypothetical protein VFD69_13645 [Vicinamibacterales bacterium]|nr:hypothetical protein [Vicinamibacterales bacterium]
MSRLQSRVVRFTWSWAIVFVPIETYLVSLRRGRPYAEGLLATGWAWTTAVFWRATNLRYEIARDGEPLDFRSLELWLAPVFTLMAGAALAGSVVLLLNRDGPAA